MTMRGRLVLWVFCAMASAAAAEISYELTKIDEGTAWVSSYWGYNAPKLIYDGDRYFTVGLWGTEQATATGALYALRDGQWHKGYTWEGLNYQPGMLLLDSAQRPILIYPRQGVGPVILRSRQRGAISDFDAIATPAWLDKAGYIGAGIYDDRIVLGYIGDPATYSFNIAVLDLKTMVWQGPFLLARAQREVEPWTTWLYPIILPDADGFHLTVSNQPAAAASYNAILYMYLPYDRLADPPVPEVVARVEPWGGNMAFGEAMWRARDGSMYVTGQYKPERGENRLHVYRRDPQTAQWHAQSLSPAQVAAVFEDRGGGLWLTSTYWDALRLYRGADWQVEELADFAEYGLVSSFFLHGIHPGSGSVMPAAPVAVFSAGAHPQYQLWFARFTAAPGQTAVAAVAAPTGYALDQNFPNPFNGATAIRYALPAAGEVDLAVFNLLGHRVARLDTGYQAAGAHEAAWDGLDEEGQSLAAGVYFYRLRYRDQLTVRKLVLLP